MNLQAQLVYIANLYAGAVNRSRARVSTIVFGNGQRLDQFERGEFTPTVRTFERSMQWFSDNWPDIIEWPPEIPRPTPQVNREVVS